MYADYVKKDSVVIVFLLVLLVLFQRVTIGKEQIFDSLTFYASFDNSLEPDNYAGAYGVSGSYESTEGVCGNGIQCNGSRIKYASPGNHSRIRGTLSIWYYPDYEKKVKTGRLFEKHWFRIDHNTINDELRFLTGKNTKDKGYLWDYSTMTSRHSFSEGWNHIVITWDGASGAKKLYVNGSMVANGNTQLMGTSVLPDFWLGEELYGKLDELMIWSDLLNANQIERLYKEKTSIAFKAHELAPLLKEEEAWKIYPGLVHKNFSNSLVDKNEIFKFSVPVRNKTDKKQIGIIKLNLLDFDENIITAKEYDIELEAGEKSSLPSSYKADKYGIYKIEAEVICGDLIKKRDITTFGCVPSMPPKRHPFFGIHVRSEPHKLKMADRLGLWQNRVLNTSVYTWWLLLQPEPDQWREAFGGQYEKYQNYGMRQLGVFYGTPYWASRNPDGSIPKKQTGYPEGLVPYEWDAFENYIKQIVLEYPDIKDWEIWNEPYVSLSWYGSPEQYAELCEKAYGAVKEVRPDTRVFAEIDATAWGDAACKAGVLEHCDGVSFHWYHGATKLGAAHQRVQDVKKLIAKYSDKDFPLINSEAGMGTSMYLRGLDDPKLAPISQRKPHKCRIQAIRYVQYAAEQIAEGIENCYYYFLVKPELGRQDSTYAMLEVTATPRPFAISLCMFIHQLDGGCFVSHHKLADELYAYVFERKDGKLLISLWTELDAEVKYHLAGEYYDMMGNELGYKKSMEISGRPVYCHLDGSNKNYIDEVLKNTKCDVIKSSVIKDQRGDDEFKLKEMQDYSIAAELGADKMIKIDISDAVNMALADETPNDGRGGWSDEGSLNDMKDLEPGEHIWHGIPFEIIDPSQNDGKSVLTLYGRTLQTGPVESQEIPVNLRNVRALIFAHAANWATKKGEQIAYYELKYADGETRRLPVVVSENIYDWWRDQQEGEYSRTVAIKASVVLSPTYPYRFIRTWYCQNPRKPSIPIESIRVVSNKKNASLILLGVTAAIQK